MSLESTRVLVVEDEVGHALLIRRALEASLREVHVTVARTLAQAREQLDGQAPDLALVDLKLPDGQGTDLLTGELGATRCPVVIMTSHGDEQMAVEALKAGALDYVVKSFEIFDEIPRIAERALREWRHIEERREAERALRESEERLQSILDNAPTVVYVKDLEGRYLTVNRRFEQLFSLSRESLLGRAGHEVLPAVTAAMFRQHDEAVIAADDAREFDEVLSHRDGDRTYLSVKFPLHDVAGRAYAVCSISTDITERKKSGEERRMLERQLRQSKRLETIGTLAGGIAHDFNNILTPIVGFGEMALEEIPPDNRAHSDLRHVLKAAQRAQNLVQHILIFSRQAEPERRRLELGAVVGEALQLLRASLPTTIEIRKEIRGPCVVHADSTQLVQLILNLGTNAFHAMRESGGVLEVRVEPDAGERHARLTVRDTGHGMDRETLDRIFEPFFTRKGVHEGTGLGLSVVHGIVKGHEGEIAIDSEPGEGTTVRICLPLAEDEVPEDAAETESLAIPRGDERVLLVDDEEDVALIQKEILERLGYRVTVETSSTDALAAFRAAPGAFDVVVTDQTMPRMTGAKLARALLEIRPGIPIILTTGFSESVSPEESKKMGIREYLMKPLVTREIGHAIRRALDDMEKER